MNLGKISDHRWGCKEGPSKGAGVLFCWSSLISNIEHQILCRVILLWRFIMNPG
jgi:hypothetical protein